MLMFQEYFLSFTTSKLTEKVALTKKAPGKTSAILCRCCDNCLDAANSYSQIIKPSTCVFLRFRIELNISIKCKYMLTLDTADFIGNVNF